MTVVIIGVSCVYCGCTEDSPCFIPENMQDVVGSAVCDWLIPGKVCNAPSCLEQHYRDLVKFIEPTIREFYAARKVAA